MHTFKYSQTQVDDRIKPHINDFVQKQYDNFQHGMLFDAIYANYCLKYTIATALNVDISIVEKYHHDVCVRLINVNPFTVSCYWGIHRDATTVIEMVALTDNHLTLDKVNW